MGDPEPLKDVLARSPLLLTPEEAAVVLRIGRTTVYALMKAGDLRPVHIGRSCRLSRAELERYVHRLETPPPSARLDRAVSGGLPRTSTAVRVHLRPCETRLTCAVPAPEVTAHRDTQHRSRTGDAGSHR